MTHVTLLPILEDNYIWLFQTGSKVIAVDPGQALPLMRALHHGQAQLAAVFVTHHHSDHTAGLPDLLAQWPTLAVYGPAEVAGVNHPLQGGETVSLLNHAFHVLATPGHTLNHLCYYTEGWLFCGDTLFAAGCGRLFEGTPTQMLQSLQRLAALSLDTQVCCAHEYTVQNLRFANTVEPNNLQLARLLADSTAQQQKGHPTLPSSIRQERQTNPFLRCDQPRIRDTVRRSGVVDLSPLSIFTTLRQWKDCF